MECTYWFSGLHCNPSRISFGDLPSDVANAVDKFRTCNALGVPFEHVVEKTHLVQLVFLVGLNWCLLSLAARFWRCSVKLICDERASQTPYVSRTRYRCDTEWVTWKYEIDDYHNNRRRPVMQSYCVVREGKFCSRNLLVSSSSITMVIEASNSSPSMRNWFHRLWFTWTPWGVMIRLETVRHSNRLQRWTHTDLQICVTGIASRQRIQRERYSSMWNYMWMPRG